MFSARRFAPGGSTCPPFLFFQPLKSISRLKFLVPTANELEKAIGTLAWAMDQINLQWGLIGGSAVFLYATSYGLPSRLTPNIDILIQPDPRTGASSERLTRFLCRTFPFYFATKRIDGVDMPQVRVPRGDREVLVDVQIYDHFMYGDRRADYDLRLQGTKMQLMQVDGQDAVLLHPTWLLKQKLLMWSERKREVDKLDIETLCDYLDETSMTLTVSGERDIKVLEGFLKEFEQDPDVLAAVIVCPKVFGPWYKLNWVRRTLAGFLFFAAPLVLDYLTSTID